LPLGVTLGDFKVGLYVWAPHKRGDGKERKSTHRVPQTPFLTFPQRGGPPKKPEAPVEKSNP